MSTAEQRFTEMYERHYADVERYVRRRAADVAVRDVVAEVFLVGWRRFDELPDPALPWLYGVARKILANELRGIERSGRLQARVMSMADPHVRDYAEDVAGRLAVAAAFDSLPHLDQETLRVIAWEQLSLRDAAKAQGCSVATFGMRLHRARRRLRRALDAASANELTAEVGGR